MSEPLEPHGIGTAKVLQVFSKPDASEIAYAEFNKKLDLDRRKLEMWDDAHAVIEGILESSPGTTPRADALKSAKSWLARAKELQG